ncbi:cold-shock protein, partial [Sphingomonas koreensis]|uniref:cold-shock protein n=1 Tax=Sphingomonas koreensis TaxID=93064 RepID=UPI0019D0516F
MRIDPQRASNEFVPVPAGAALPLGEDSAQNEDCSGEQYSGAVKWFDVTRGFGFLVADDPAAGDILIHFSVLQPHGRRSLPEGARVVCTVVRRERGLQAREVLSIDLTDAVEPVKPRGGGADRADRLQLIESAGPFEPVAVKWFNRLKAASARWRDRWTGRSHSCPPRWDWPRRGRHPDWRHGRAAPALA